MAYVRRKSSFVSRDPNMSKSANEFWTVIKKKNELTRSDVSIYPSYTNLVIPFRVICRQRYIKAGKKQRKQFNKEIRENALLQAIALDGVRVHREFCDTVLVPPKVDESVTITKKQRRRIDELMKYDLNRI